MYLHNVGGFTLFVVALWHPAIVGAQCHKMNHRLYYEPLPSTTDGCLNLPSLFNHTIATTIAESDSSRTRGWAFLHIQNIFHVLYVVGFPNCNSDRYDNQLYFAVLLIWMKCIIRCVRILCYNSEIYKKFLKYIGNVFIIIYLKYIKNTKRYFFITIWLKSMIVKPILFSLWY